MSNTDPTDGGEGRKTALPRQRLALGVTMPACVPSAIDRLVAAGIPAGQMAVVAEDGALDEKALRSIGARNASEPLMFLRRHEAQEGSGAGETLARGMPSLRRWLVDFEGWLTRDLSLDLDRYLKSGAVVLAVLMGLGEVDRTVSEILLDVCIDSVQFHDIA